MSSIKSVKSLGSVIHCAQYFLKIQFRRSVVINSEEDEKKVYINIQVWESTKVEHKGGKIHAYTYNSWKRYSLYFSLWKLLLFIQILLTEHYLKSRYTRMRIFSKSGGCKKVIV